MGVTAAVAAVASVAVAYNNGEESKRAAERARQQAQDNANRQAAQADQDMNRANQKKPDTSAILSAASQAGKAGASGTMLTGPQGVDPNALNLGKNTLLGV
jgi:Flp pilus assembly protein TadB